jgi:hypothetical protein
MVCAVTVDTPARHARAAAKNFIWTARCFKVVVVKGHKVELMV